VGDTEGEGKKARLPAHTRAGKIALAPKVPAEPLYPYAG